VALLKGRLTSLTGLLMFVLFFSVLKAEWVEDGLKAYRKADFLRAITILERGLRESVIPDSLKIEVYKYLGAAYTALGADVKVKRYYEEILALDPLYELSESEFSPKLVKKFEEVREPLMVEVIVASDPSGAEVAVETRYSRTVLGITSEELKVRLVRSSGDKANYRLIFRKEGYYPDTVETIITGGERITGHLRLMTGVLHVDTKPRGANLYLRKGDGGEILGYGRESLGPFKTPRNVELPVGYYKLQVDKSPIYRKLERFANVWAGDTTKVFITLTYSREYEKWKEIKYKEWMASAWAHKTTAVAFRIVSFLSALGGGVMWYLGDESYDMYKGTMDPAKIRKYRRDTERYDKGRIAFFGVSAVTFLISLILDMTLKEPDYEREFLSWKGVH